MVALLVALASAIGAADAARDHAIDRRWVAAGLLVSAVAVWAGVPETGPAIVVGGVIAGISLAVGSAGLSAGGAATAVAAITWAALAGAAGRPWATVGGALCLGVGPGLAVRHLVPGAWGRQPGPWLLVAHVVLAAVAARWIGVTPNAGWDRVALMLGASLTVGAATRRSSLRGP